MRIPTSRHVIDANLRRAHSFISSFISAIVIALFLTLLVVFNAEVFAWPFRSLRYSISQTARGKMEQTSNNFPVDWAETLASIKKGTYMYSPCTLNLKRQFTNAVSSDLYHEDDYLGKPSSRKLFGSHVFPGTSRLVQELLKFFVLQMFNRDTSIPISVYPYEFTAFLSQINR